MELSYRSIFIKELNFNMMKGKKRGREEESKEEKRRGEGGEKTETQAEIIFLHCKYTTSCPGSHCNP